MKNTSDDEVLVEASSGNVFADIGMSNPELRLAKATLVVYIRRAITAQKLSHVKAAKLLKVDPDKLKGLLIGKTDGFTLDRLYRFLILLGQRIEIVVTPQRTAN